MSLYPTPTVREALPALVQVAVFVGLLCSPLPLACLIIWSLT